MNEEKVNEIIKKLKENNITNLKDALDYYKKNNKEISEEELILSGIQYILEQKYQT
ncbi:MAG TPA: hypothetical protein PLD27_05015 [bacterium]|nr:hypothetical protein [bacterium]HOL48615.1 hypothetical protein [bacterium]HPQ19049.1 hypothetical protein [bacterium]